MKICSFLPDAGAVLLFSPVRAHMKVDFRPPRVRLNGLFAFRPRQCISPGLFHRFLYSVPVVFALMLALMLAGSLAAQQASTGADSSSLAAITGTSDPSHSDMPAQSNGASGAASGNAQSASSAGSASNGVPPQTTRTDVPNQPATQNQSDDQGSSQTRRILDVIPNFRAVSAGQWLPPQSVKEKFVTATEDSFDYSSAVIPVLLAGYSMATDATPEFGHGGAGYARYLWHAAVDQTSENYMVEFVVPAVMHEDTRYYTMGSGGFLKRTGYALSRAVITRSDSGKEVFNSSEVIGAGASSGLSSLYYPSRERSFANTGKEWGLDVGIDAASFVAKEFWPDINQHLFHGGKPADHAQQ
jgi:hypothetical protein